MKTPCPLTPSAAAAQPAAAAGVWRRLMAFFFNPLILYAIATVVSAGIWQFTSSAWGLAGLAGLVIWPALAVVHFELSGITWMEWKIQLGGGKVYPTDPAPSSHHSK